MLTFIILNSILLYFIIASNQPFIIFILLMIEPIILIKLNRNIILKTIPIGIPFGNVVNSIPNNTFNHDYYDNIIHYHDNNLVIGNRVNI